MKREWIGFLFLLLLSVRDIREKKVNIAFLLPGVVLAFYQMPDGFLRAEVPGFLFSILFFVLSILTKEAIGKGDAFAVLLCACYLPFYPVFFIFLLSITPIFIFCSIFIYLPVFISNLMSRFMTCRHLHFNIKYN